MKSMYNLSRGLEWVLKSQYSKFDILPKKERLFTHLSFVNGDLKICYKPQHKPMHVTLNWLKMLIPHKANWTVYIRIENQGFTQIAKRPRSFHPH